MGIAVWEAGKKRGVMLNDLFARFIDWKKNIVPLRYHNLLHLERLRTEYIKWKNTDDSKSRLQSVYKITKRV
ncbi:MAG: hypothetical protein AAFY76_01290 [Cyanobacteria bacterium J06649_11]